MSSPASRWQRVALAVLASGIFAAALAAQVPAAPVTADEGTPLAYTGRVTPEVSSFAEPGTEPVVEADAQLPVTGSPGAATPDPASAERPKPLIKVRGGDPVASGTAHRGPSTTRAKAVFNDPEQPAWRWLIGSAVLLGAAFAIGRVLGPAGHHAPR